MSVARQDRPQEDRPKEEWPTGRKRKLKILMLHGYTQSGPLFHAKTHALERKLNTFLGSAGGGGGGGGGGEKGTGIDGYDGVQLVYPTAPNRVYGADIPDFPATTDTAANLMAMDNRGPSGQDDVEAWGWWRVENGAKEDETEKEKESARNDSRVYVGVEASLDQLAAVLVEQGPFHGVIGFSQGATLAAMLASLLEPGRRAAFDRANTGFAYPPSFVRECDPDGAAASRSASPLSSRENGDIAASAAEAEAAPAASAAPASAGADGQDSPSGPIHPPFGFVVSYSGFRANNTLYSPFYAPAIATPSLHAIGTLDTVVEAERSEELLHACAEGSRQLLHHPGGHYVPSTQRHILALLFSFIKQALSSSTSSGV